MSTPPSAAAIKRSGFIAARILINLAEREALAEAQRQIAEEEAQLAEADPE